MKTFVKENITKVFLFLIIAAQLMLVCFTFSKKEGYFIDEVLSFSLANREGTGYFHLPEHMWVDNEWYLQNMTAQEGSAFDFSIAYKNQVQDVSPPLFYMLLHGVCSLFPGQLSPWMGLGLNLFFYVGTVILMYYLGKEIFQDENIGLLIAGLFGITYGVINTVIFLRMYMMATFMLLFHLSVYIHYFEKEKIPLKGYILFIVSAVLGSLTQYYFLVGAVFLGIWYVVRFLFEKRYAELKKYLVSACVSAGTAVLIFPAMLRHILKSGRGAASFESLSHGENYFAHLKEMFRILNEEMFAGILVPMMVILLLGMAVLLWKKDGRAIFEKRYWIPVLTACAGYFLVVTKVAPYQTDRYIMPTFPLAYFLIVGAALAIFSHFLEKKKLICICLLIFASISIRQLSTSSFHYLYEGYQKYNVAQDYTDEYCVVISDDHGNWYYDIQALTQYRAFYWLRDTENTALMDEIIEKIEPEGKFVLYGRNTWTQGEIIEYIKTHFGENWSCDLIESCGNERFLIYHCRME